MFTLQTSPCDRYWKGVDTLTEEEDVTKFAIALAAGLLLSGIGSSFASAETLRAEAADHPRIATAIRELEAAILYMEAAPHDFGGHKAAAIRDSRAALVQLRLALAYRARRDR
jgi:hypothetical protein